MSCSIQAQPVLNASDFGVDYSSEIFISSSSALSPGSAGENQVWDFSNLELLPSTSLSISDSSSNPFLSLFPEVNYSYNLLSQTNNIHEFYKLSNSSFEYLGFVNLTTTNVENYSSNSQILFQFPFTYNSTINDTYQQQGSSIEQELTSVYDGYGTLITPFGTNFNVIRTKRIRGLNNVNYYWFTVNPYKPIMTGYFETNGIIRVFQNIDLSSFQVTNTKSNFSIYPNPTNGNISIKNSNSIDKEVAITICDVLGNAIIENKKFNLALQNLDLSDFSSGVYFVKITDKNNQLLYSDKIVKQ